MNRAWAHKPGRLDQANATIVSAFRAMADRHGTARAVVYGAQSLSYHELDQRSDALAADLAGRGIGPGDLVGISSQRRIELIVAVMAVLKAGAGYVPFDISLPPARLAFMGQDTGITLLLGACPAAGVESLGWDAFPQKPTPPPKPALTGEDIAYVMYTSGTTGTPKGVVLPHRSVLRLLVETDWLDLGPQTITLHSSAFAFDTSIIDIFAALLNGGCVVIPPDGPLGFADLADAITGNDVNTLWLTAGLFHGLADTQPQAFKAVGQVIVGGDIVSPVQVGKVMDLCPDLTVINGYGPTESNVTNAYRITPQDITSAKPLPIGKSVPGTQTFVIGEDLHPLPAGETGELAIAGRGLALGYWNRPDLTAQAFVPAPWDDSLTLYRSGDLVRDPGDGVLEFFGRSDAQVKIRGFRVELGEVEAALEAHERIGQAALIVRDQADAADKALIGFYVAARKIAETTLKAHLAALLPAYAMPARLHHLKDLPITANGKIDRKTLAQMDAPDPSAVETPVLGAPCDLATPKSARSRPEQGALVETIARITQEVLDSPRPDTSANFFDLGASSLHVARIHDGVQKALDRRFPITDFFAHSTIASLASHLAGDAPRSAAAPKRAQASGDIAIIGMAGRFPSAPDIAALWDGLTAGREMISHFAPEELDIDPRQHDPQAPYVAARGVMDGAALFDAPHFGMTRREAEQLDPQHRVLLEVAQTALDHAGLDPDRAGGRIGVFAGAAAQNSYLLNNLASAPGAARALAAGYPVEDVTTLFGNQGDFLATRLAYKLNLTGPAVNVQSACSTSLLAVAQACDAIRAGHADMAIAGGVAITFPQKRPYLYTPDGMAAADGHCRAFDADATGTVFGDGAGMVVLAPLEDALDAGHQIYAVIKGYAVNNDGSAKAGYAAPSVKAQADVIRDAHQAADVDPDTIGYIEAHGTGTALGDPIEFAALREAFGDKGDCLLGAVKTNLGHLDAASGITGLIKTVLSLHLEAIPPLVHYQAPNPAIDFNASPFRPATTLIPWTRSDQVRRAGVTALGVGGTNVHMVLEEAPDTSPAQTLLPPALTGPQIYPVSASSGDALAARVADLKTWAAQNAQAAPAALLHTLRARTRTYSHRAVLVADGMAGLAAATPTRSARAADRTQCAFLFSGQGAQYAQMGATLYAAEPVFKAAFDLCAELLEPDLGHDLRHVVFNSDTAKDTADDLLKNTALTQPATFALSYALAKQWAHWGVTPDAMIGHSIGEFAAATLAGVMDLPDALKLIALRGRLMADLPTGTMLSVRAAPADLAPYLGDLDLAVINGAQLCVLAGPGDAADALLPELEAAGFSPTKLHTSHAFHSRMMAPAVAPFRAALVKTKLSAPSIPILSTVTGEWLTDGQATSPDYWADHITKPVRFYDAIATLWDQNQHVFIECGPGRVLATLAAQNPARDAAPAIASLPSAQDDTDAHTAMLEAFGQLWAHGNAIDWDRQTGVKTAGHVTLPPYPFQREEYWVTPSDAQSPTPNAVQSVAPKPDLSALDALKALLSDLSGTPPEAMANDAYFLELGFDSLLLTQAIKEISDRFGITLALRDLIEGFSTLDELADHLEQNGSTRGQTVTDRAQPMAEMTRIEIASSAPVSAPISAPTTKIDRTSRDLDPLQRASINRLITRYTAKTARSKALTAQHRGHLADPRTASGFNRHWKEIVYQITSDRSLGSRLLDVDGNEYIDILNGFGPGFLGHGPAFLQKAIITQMARGMEVGPQHEVAYRAAELFCEVTGNERVSFVVTGSEAVYAAMRLARTVTGRDKIVMFARDYHGNFDEVLVRGVQGPDGPRTMPLAPGVPRDAVKNAIVLPYGSAQALEYIRAHGHELAAVLVEPVQSRRPEFQPAEFIREVRALTEQSDTALIFDEVITGFRFGPRGAQDFYGVEADIVTYGKIPGGGMPIGAVAGKARFMDTFDGGAFAFGDDSAPEAPVTFFAGTFVRHPAVMAATAAMLEYLKGQTPFFWKAINAKGDRLAGHIHRWFEDNDMPFEMPNCGSLMYLRIGEDQQFGPLMGAHMRDRGVYILEGFPSYLTAAHNDDDIDYVIDAIKDSALEMRAGGLLTGRDPVPYEGPKVEAVPPRLSLPSGTQDIRDGMDAPPAPITVPTTPAQREIWAALLVTPEVSAAYNESVILTLDGAIDRTKMMTAIADAFDRHDALNVRFPPDGQTMQVHAATAHDIRLMELDREEQAIRQTRLEAILSDEVRTPFDLETGPFIRARLVAMGEDHTHLIVTAHHIVCDGWSIDVVIRDIAKLYCAERLATPGSIIDYARAQARDTDTAAQAYWLKTYQDLPPVLDLPTDHPRKPVRSVRGARADFALPPDLVGPLRKFAASHGATFVNLMLAAYKLHIARAARLDDIVIGLPAAGQAASGMPDLVGHCVNLLPIRTQINWQGSFAAHLGAVRNTLMDAFAHQSLTFGDLVRALKLQRDPSRATLVPVVFNIDTGIDLSGLNFGPANVTEFVTNPRVFEHFDLFLNVVDQGDHVLTEWSYGAALFEPATIKAHFEAYVALLRQVMAAPDAALDSLNLPELTARETTAAPQAPDPKLQQRYATPIGDLVRAHSAATPHASALEWQDQHWSYADLDTVSDTIAAGLQAAGIAQGDRVGLIATRSGPAVLAMLACLKAGAVYVPLPRDFPAERLQMMAQDAQIKLMLGHLPALDTLGIPNVEIAALMACKTPFHAPDLTGEAPAYVMYTSGSTGKPKGVLVPHRGITRLVSDQNYMEVSADTRVLHNAPLAFDASTFEIWTALLNGAALIVADDDHLGVGPLTQLIAERRITWAFLTTGLYHLMASEAPHAFATLHQLLTGGDVVSPAATARILNACPALTAVNCYGPTENTVASLCHPIRAEDLINGQPLPIGQAIRGTDIYIVDSAMRPVQGGEAGELCVAGAGLALGYLNRPEETAKAFVTALWDPTLKLYRTGDLVRRDGDGLIHYLGRLDGQVKIRGHRVEITEVETALETHPAIARAVVQALTPPGQSDKVLVAHYVANTALEPRDLRAHLKPRLPHYARPALMQAIDAIPINANGKVSYADLPAPNFTGSVSGEAPQTETESALAAIWKETLGRGHIGVTDNFFELGGHSLLAVRIFERIRTHFGAELPISTLFENQTIRDLADVIYTQTGITVDDASMPWDTSTVLHHGPSGAAAPFFVVGGVGGNVNNLFELGKLLGQNRPVIGFQTRGVLGHDPHKSLADIAADNLTYLRQHQPTGPYTLAGYSGGALTAFEMACQLEAMGEQVARLFVLDSYAPGFKLSDMDRRMTPRDRVHNEHMLLRNEGIGYFFQRLRGKLKTLTMRGPIPKLVEKMNRARYRTHVIERSWSQAAANYPGNRFAGPTTLVFTKPRSLIEHRAFAADPWLGWRSMCNIDRLDKQFTDGDHLSMVSGANVQTLSRLIEKRIKAP